jgi:NhaP-type Na+/H+ or K+/H+ antiporter
MDTLLLGLLLGFIAGYLVRSLVSQMRRRRFEEEYGHNPRSHMKQRS